MVIAVLLRVAAALALGNQVVDLPGTFDQISYHNLALRVLDGHGFSFGETWWPVTPAEAPTAHWSFLYTLYLVAMYATFGVQPLIPRLVQAVITGLLHPLLACQIGTALFSRKVGLVSAGLTAVYAYFIYYDATLMTEPLFITFVLAGLYLAMRLAAPPSGPGASPDYPRAIRLSILLGLVLGAAILLRQLILLFVPFLFAWLWWARRKLESRSTRVCIAVGVAIISGMILPFSIYNTARFGRFVLLNTNSGYAFFWANHPVQGISFQGILSDVSYQSLIPEDLRNLDEAALDQALLRRGVQIVLDDPPRYILLSISRIPVFFKFWPSSDSGLLSNISRVGSFGILWPFMLAGLWRALAGYAAPARDRMASPIFLTVIFVGFYTAIHLLSWSLIRYRLPVDAVLVTFAGLALVEMVDRVKARRVGAGKTAPDIA